MDNVVEVVFDYDDTVDEVDFTKDLLNAVALEAEDREPMVLDYGEDESCTIPAVPAPSTSHSTQPIPTLNAKVVPTKPQKLQERGGLGSGAAKPRPAVDAPASTGIPEEAVDKGPTKKGLRGFASSPTKQRPAIVGPSSAGTPKKAVDERPAKTDEGPRWQ
ncbi:hypothetical protein AAVH_16794 [Aphelenchoides avenae]|nr:hypothetical protein AAVH_16794 [Aphelenchus avenae]